LEEKKLGGSASELNGLGQITLLVMGVWNFVKERPVVTRNMIMCGESDFSGQKLTEHSSKSLLFRTYAE
jgi:hypothetical protein